MIIDIITSSSPFIYLACPNTFTGEPPKESPVKAFSRIMEKVVFAMSGYQNPYRGELRDRAVAMGAKYKPDWGKGCTHLM